MAEQYVQYKLVVTDGVLRLTGMKQDHKGKTYSSQSVQVPPPINRDSMTAALLQLSTVEATGQ